MPDNRLYHILSLDTLRAFRGSGHYHPASLEREGFIHTCEAHQIQGVWQRYYQDQPDLALIELQPGDLKATVRYEDTTGRGEAFPHIYGSVPWSAVVASSLLADWLNQSSLKPS